MKAVQLWCVGLVLVGIITPTSAFVLNQRLRVTEAEVKAMQRCLQALGYDPGRTDGAWGPRTHMAFIQWLFQSGLPAHAADTRIGQRFAQDCTVAVAPHHSRPQRPAQPTFQYGLTKGEVRQILGVPYDNSSTGFLSIWRRRISMNWSKSGNSLSVQPSRDGTPGFPRLILIGGKPLYWLCDIFGRIVMSQSISGD